MVYCKVGILMKMVSCKVVTTDNKFMFWEIVQKLPELQSTANVADDGIL